LPKPKKRSSKEKRNLNQKKKPEPEKKYGPVSEKKEESKNIEKPAPPKIIEPKKDAPEPILVKPTVDNQLVIP